MEIRTKTSGSARRRHPPGAFHSRPCEAGEKGNRQRQESNGKRAGEALRSRGSSARSHDRLFDRNPRRKVARARKISGRNRTGRGGRRRRIREERVWRGWKQARERRGGERGRRANHPPRRRSFPAGPCRERGGACGPREKRKLSGENPRRGRSG